MDWATVKIAYIFDFQQYFSYIMASVLLMDEIGIHGENHRPAASASH
jgi:hypothetical protein